MCGLKVISLFFILSVNYLLFGFCSHNVNQCEANHNSSDYILSLAKAVIPALEGKRKGDAGKIGVIGGSTEYTGAPYFSAITALKTGADLVYVITTENASPIIKQYSPDLIVYPFLHKNMASKINTLLRKMDVIVIGPGLGREEETLKFVYNLLEDCKKMRKPIIIDADGLYVISKNVTIIQNYPSPGVIMTPNYKEARHLMYATTNDTNWPHFWGNNVSVLIKGDKDQYISNMLDYNWYLSEGGSSRRAGGQGDILSGALATFYNWALQSRICKSDNIHIMKSAASFASAKLIRECNSKAYQLYGRSMTASDMLHQIYPAFQHLFSTI